MKIEKTPIFLDKERYLVYDLSAFYDIDKKYGSTSKALKAISEDLPGSISYLLHVGLAHEEVIPVDQIELWIDLSTQVMIKKTITHSLSIATPEPSEQPTSVAQTNANPDDGWNWDWLYYIGTVLLEMSEAVFWRCTMRKLLSLWEIHRRFNRFDSEDAAQPAVPPGYIDQFI